MKKVISILCFSALMLGTTTNLYAKKSEGYDSSSIEFNKKLKEEENKQLEIDRELEMEEQEMEKNINAIALKISDDQKYDYWIIRPQARNLFMAIEKNVMIGEVNKAKELVDEFGDFVDLPGSDMAEFAVFNVAKYLVYKEYGELGKAKISCVRALKITSKRELFIEQEFNKRLTDIFCSEYLPEFEDTEGKLLHRRKEAIKYVISHSRDGRIAKHVKYLALMNRINEYHGVDRSIFSTMYKSGMSKLVAMYGIQSIEKANYLLAVAKKLMTQWQERDESLFLLKTGYKMSVKLLRQRYEKNPNNNLLIGKFLMNIANNYYSSISYKQSIPYYEKAAQIFKKNGFDYYLVESLKNLSYVYRLSRDVDKALKTVAVTLKEAERVYGRNSVEYGSILIIEADIYNIDKDYSNSIRDLKEARRIFAEKYGEYSNKVKLIDLNIKYVELDEEASF